MLVPSILTRATMMGLLSAWIATACTGNDGEKTSMEAAAVSPEYAQEIEAWRARRLERLVSDTGYLTLAGLFWLKEGDNTFGSDPSNDFVFPAGPAHAGVFTHAGGVTRVRALEGVSLLLNDKPVTENALRTDQMEETDVVHLENMSFYIIQRGDRFGVRMRWLESPVRKAFRGIEHFPTSAAYRVEARFEPYVPPKHIPVASVVGNVDTMLCPGAFVFEVDGKEERLDPVVESPDDNSMWLIFNDATSGDETYGGGRFLYTDRPVDGKVIVDFNKAYNPPCAFSPYTTCPLPPFQNHLDVPVRAGEKKYAEN